MKINLAHKPRVRPPWWPFAILALLLLNFNNCSSSSMSYDETPEKMSGENLDLSSVCAQTDETIFAQGFHQFLKTTCNNCHVAGPGKGTFAHPTSSIAWASFESMGYEKISAMAVSDAHNSPYTGAHNISRISALKEQWKTFQTEKLNCANKGDTNSSGPVAYVPQLITIKKTIPKITGTNKTVNINGTNTNIVEYNVASLQFDLDKELQTLTETPPPNTAGGIFTLSVTGYTTPSGTTGYVIEMPKLKTGGNSLKLSGMHIHINGQPIRYTYTFQNIQRTLYKGTETMLSGGSMLALGPLLEGDQIAITFGSLEVVDMAAPPAPPTVQFQLAGATIQPTDLGLNANYKITVTVSGDNTNPITVGVTTVGDEKLPGVALGLAGPGGRNRFNWDYRIKSSMNLNFLPGETEKSIEILFSDDERDDVTKTLTLRLADPFGAKLGTNATTILTIPDYNSAPTGVAPTFAQLMSPGGILEANCVRCHNSIEKQGGYDMTDYSMMVSKGIIVPGDLTPTNHKMFRRMNPDASGTGTITPMPLDGFLVQELTDYVEQWLTAGAKNN